MFWLPLITTNSCILGETKSGKDSEPFAVNSYFNWIIAGYYENSIVSTPLAVYPCCVQI